MKEYADFDYYINTFNGNVIDSELLFKRMSIEASYILDEITIGRIKEASEEVKMATCAIAEINYQEFKQNNEDQIASESVGPHSVSYVKKTKTTEEYAKEKLKIARMYLARTGLLYRGVVSCL